MCVYVHDVSWGGAAESNRCGTGNHLAMLCGKSTVRKHSRWSLAAFKREERNVASSRAILIALACSWNPWRRSMDLHLPLTAVLLIMHLKITDSLLLFKETSWN